jgi:IS30 family transposase
MKHKHLTLEQRYQIDALLQTGTPKNKIAQIVETDRSTVYREINRNRNKRPYSAKLAQKLCDERKERFSRGRKFTPEMKSIIREKMEKEQWSPCQIVGHSRVNCIPMVSHTLIYEYIRYDKEAGGKLWTHTRHQLKHRKRPVGEAKTTIKNRVSIEERPAVVDERSRCGDWEMDTIVGKNQKGAIVTIVERKTGFLLMEKLPHGKQAEPLSKTAVRMLSAYKKTVHTITSDNGTEFASHEYIADKLGAKYYFAHPYSSWERGLSEYTNKLVRQYIIKGSDFDLYDDNFIKEVQYKINRRPREKLNFNSPLKVFFCSLN